MAVTGTITTKFVDEKGVDLGRQLVEKDYLISVYPNLVPQLKSAGLFTWGRNLNGQLGDGTVTNRSSPVQTITYSTNWKFASCGYNFTAATKTDGTLWGWGNNQYGQLGDNSAVHRLSPVQNITFASNWLQVSCGSNHTAAIKTDGTLWTWGRNAYGNLGNNSMTFTGISSPIQTISGGTNWGSVSCGYSLTGAIKTDGTLWLWGDNDRGQLGDNTRLHRSSPVQTVTGGTNWSQVSCGSNHTAAIKTDGTLWIWGRNAYGQLGDNTLTSKSSPVQTIAGGTNWSSVACGSEITAAIKTDGTLWTWGINNIGQLGDNTLINRSSPVQTIAGSINWKKVSTGNFHIAAIKTDGILWTWGQNAFGNLGDLTVSNKSSPIQVISGANTWKQVSAGGRHTAAIRDFNY